MDLIKDQRELAIARDFSPHKICDHLFVGRTQHKGSLIPIHEPKEFFAVQIQSSTFSPEICWLNEGKLDLKGTGAVHLLPQDSFNLTYRAEPRGEEVVDSRSYLPDHTCSEKEAVAGGFCLFWICS
jgi:hypothetical protein